MDLVVLQVEKGDGARFQSDATQRTWIDDLGGAVAGVRPAVRVAVDDIGEGPGINQLTQEGTIVAVQESQSPAPQRQLMQTGQPSSLQGIHCQPQCRHAVHIPQRKVDGKALQGLHHGWPANITTVEEKGDPLGCENVARLPDGVQVVVGVGENADFHSPGKMIAESREVGKYRKALYPQFVGVMVELKGTKSFTPCSVYSSLGDPMPTPVNHLLMAREVLEQGKLIVPAQRVLQAQYGAFLLGHTAPDVQTVSGQRREETHFYTLPPNTTTPAVQALLDAHPSLAHAEFLEPPHAAFMAGYLAHLLADELWWREIFHPFFGPNAEWDSWEERLFLHNVLRTWLDEQDQARLNGREAELLARVEPRGWLPFIQDEALRAWRDELVEQLRPGHRIRTAEVFAERMGVPAEALEKAARSPEQMAWIFRHVSPEHLQRYREKVTDQSVRLINRYLERVNPSGQEGQNKAPYVLPR